MTQLIDPLFLVYIHKNMNAIAGFFALALSSEVFVCAFIYRNRLTNIFFITPITLEHNTTIALRSSNPTIEPIRTSGTTSQPTNQPLAFDNEFWA